MSGNSAVLFAVDRRWRAAADVLGCGHKQSARTGCHLAVIEYT